MKKSVYLLICIFLVNSCAEKKIIKTVDFKPKDYKFSSEIITKLKKDTISWKYQIAASDYAIKGDYKNALIQWDSAMGTKEREPSKQQIDSMNQKYLKVNAFDYIANISKANQVIIINEAHHNSFHRVFTKALLQKLFDNGYKNLGLEALSNGEKYQDTALNNRKYPILATGYYTKDPQFGNLIREALEIGYDVFPYESVENRGGKGREIEQAKFIKEKIDEKPNEKFLIHCGFAHALEGIYEPWEKTMAGRLTEYTNINPLTIHQVIYSEKSTPKYNHPLRKALKIEEPTILIDENNKPLGYKTGEMWTDIAIFYPNTKYIENRPNWLFAYGSKKVSISLDEVQMKFPTMVFAFKKGEDINIAIPVDVAEIKNKTEICNLGLKTGIYEIVVTNGKKSLKFEQKVQ